MCKLQHPPPPMDLKKEKKRPIKLVGEKKAKTMKGFGVHEITEEALVKVPEPMPEPTDNAVYLCCV